MTPKFYLFFAFLLVNSQDIFASNLSAIQRSLSEAADIAVTYLDTIVTEQIEQSTDNISTKRNNLETFAKSTLTTAEELIQTTYNTSLNEIKAIEDNAKVHGIDISSCTKDKVDIINNLVEDSDELSVTQYITESEEITKKAIDQINTLTNVVNELKNKLANCADGIVGMECYMEVLTEATKQIPISQQKIVSLELKAINDIDNIKSDIIEETIGIANELGILIGFELNEATKCFR